MRQYHSFGTPPTQAALDVLLEQAHVVRVFKGGVHRVGEDEALLEIRDPADLAALRANLRIADGSDRMCMCLGGPTLEILSADLFSLARLSIHHGRAIRWDHWHGDADLIDERSLAEWFARRGVVEPLRELEEEAVRDRQNQRDGDRWLTAMPKALSAVWSGTVSPFESIDVESLSAALEHGVPEEDGRILALLEWFGSGAGPWSGFPAYEIVAEELLLRSSTARLIEVVVSTRLTSAQVEGAARLFGGWAFNKQRPHDNREIPNALKQLLWDHVKGTQDSDKRTRALRAFVHGF